MRVKLWLFLETAVGVQQGALKDFSSELEERLEESVCVCVFSEEDVIRERLLAQKTQD